MAGTTAMVLLVKAIVNNKNTEIVIVVVALLAIITFDDLHLLRRQMTLLICLNVLISMVDLFRPQRKRVRIRWQARFRSCLGGMVPLGGFFSLWVEGAMMMGAGMEGDGGGGDDDIDAFSHERTL